MKNYCVILVTSAGVVWNFALPAFFFIIQVVILLFIEWDFIENYKLHRAGADDMLKQNKILRQFFSKYIILTIRIISRSFIELSNSFIRSSLSHRLCHKWGGETSSCRMFLLDSQQGVIKPGRRSNHVALDRPLAGSFCRGCSQQDLSRKRFLRIVVIGSKHQSLVLPMRWVVARLSGFYESDSCARFREESSREFFLKFPSLPVVLKMVLFWPLTRIHDDSWGSEQRPIYKL